MNKQMRITDNDFELLKSTFANRDELLKAVRNVFFDIATEDEKKMVSDTFSSNEVLRKLMRKQFLPEIQGELPIGQAVDLWMTVDLKDKTLDNAFTIITSRNKLIPMIEQALNILENPQAPTVNLNVDLKNVRWADRPDIDLIARNQFISHIDQQLTAIRILAGQPNETVEETKKRLTQDSTQ
jgi:hypothetical protein